MTQTPAQLATRKVAELQEIASSLGIESGKLRKGELVDAIVTAQGGTSALPTADSVQTESAPADAVQGASAPSDAQPSASNAPSETQDAGVTPGRRSRRATSASARSHVNEGEAGIELIPADVVRPAESADSSGSDASAEPTQGDAVQTEDAAPRESRSRNRRNRNRNARADAAETSDDKTEAKPDSTVAANDGKADETGNGTDGESNRNRNTRNRNRNRRSEDFETEILDDDVLIPIAGILDVLDNYAFVRTTGYLPGPSDVYVSLGQVKKYNLRKGDAVAGSVKQPREGEGNGRQKYNALVTVDSINGQSVDEAAKRPEFSSFTPVYPAERLRLETERAVIDTRIVDVVAPLGKGQRAVIIGEPRTGKTHLLREIANAVAVNTPDTHLMVVLVDERPEDVTHAQRTIKGEVVASTFDRPAEDHITVAELSVERAKRLVELGHDVVLLIDSLTALSRAYRANNVGGRTFGGDPNALFAVKKLFGAARKIEHGGSLTIIGTANDALRPADAMLVDELRGAATSVLHLSAELASAGVFPAIDVRDSGTVGAESFLSNDEATILGRLRRQLGAESHAAALQSIQSRLVETATNVEYLLGLQRSN